MTAPVYSVRALTKRQREIAELIGNGKSYAEIADILTLRDRERAKKTGEAFKSAMSWHTVRAHVRAIANLIDVAPDGEPLDGGALTPRERILLLVKYEHWEKNRQSEKGGL